MDIRFECHSCGQSIEVNTQSGGQEFRCPSCGVGLVVPTVITSVPKAPPPILPTKKPAKRLTGRVICGIAIPPVMMLLFGLWLASRPGVPAQVNVTTSPGIQIGRASCRERV